MIEERIHATKQYVKTLFADRADGHDVEHTLRVYTNAMRIAQAEGLCDMEVVGLSALLHDADDDKLFQTENNANARTFLDEIGTPQNRIDQICQVINAVSFSKNRGKHPETIGKSSRNSYSSYRIQAVCILDNLAFYGFWMFTAIFAERIARTFSYGGHKGRPLTDTIQHFHDKLLLLKEEMNTETAKQMAESRHQFLITFLNEIEKELY